MLSSIRSIGAVALAIAFAFTFAPTASAQFNYQWLEFTSGAGKIRNPDGSIATHITNSVDEKDMEWADLNKDGWIDVVIVNKEPFSTPGKRLSYLLMNEGGTLVDRSTQYASASTVAGDFGFNTPTNSRDVKIADVNGDGWLDVVTFQTDITNVAMVIDPKNLTHPRVYMNLGVDGGGAWLGLRYEDTRMPQILSGTGVNGMLRFCDGSFGDIDGDGDLDLYITDYDRLETSYPNEPSNLDVNDRLLMNDGNGFFTDETTTRIPIQIYTCSFGVAAKVADMNGDGRKDIVRCTTLDPTPYGPLAVTVAYNNPSAPGTFNTTLWQNSAFTGSPYHVDVADLNNDGKLDMTVSDDGADGYKFNTGNDALGRVIWSTKKNFAYLSGSGDDGISGESNRAVDLDLDGWKDVVIPDVDIDAMFGAWRFCKIFHNPGGAVGSTTIQLIEEKEMAGSGGWFGAKGILRSDLQGTFDAAFPDIDNDGDPDMILGRYTGTYVWMNRTDPCPVVNYGQALPNTTGLPATIGSNGATSISGNTLVLTCTNLPPNKTGLFFMGTTKIDPCVPFGNGLRCAGGSIKRFPGTNSGPTGTVSVQYDFTSTGALQGINPGDVRYIQFWYRDPAAGGAGYNTSDAIEITFCP